MIKFLDCNISLSKKVLEPRIETEFWVKKAIKEIESGISNKELRMLDIFAGSGCIGIAVLKNLKNSKVDFVDISKNAIEEIKVNLKLNKIPNNRFRVYQSDIFNELKGVKYDIIFANPPYVAEERINEVQKGVLEKEPHQALFAGKDGMIYIKKFLLKVKKYLKPEGFFYLEYDPQQKDKIREILKKQGFKFVFRKDQFRKYRWVRGYKL